MGFRRRTILSGLVILSGVSQRVSIADAQDATPSTQPSTADLIKRIDALETEVHQLRQQRDQTTQPVLDKHIVDTTVDAVMEDARRRDTVWQGGSLDANYTDGRLLIRTADGNYQFHPWLQFQFRDATTFRPDGKHAGTSDDAQNGFETRRLKFGVDGNVISPNLTYMIQLADDRKTGGVNLEMAWAKYHFGESGFALRAGQFKEPLDHEQLESIRTFAPVERTLVNDVFANGEGYVKGVSLLYEPGERSVRSEVAFTDGTKNSDTNYVDYPNGTSPADWGAVGRVEYKAFGRWRDYDRFSALQATEPTLVFGAGADYTEAGSRATLVHVVDAQYVDPSGLLLYGAYLGQYARNATVTAGGTADTYEPTARFLAGYTIDHQWEPFVEYSFIRFDGSTLPAGTNPDVHVISVGSNFYPFRSANFKLQIDLSYLPNGSPVNDDGAAILLSAHPNEFIVRTQFQLLL